MAILQLVALLLLAGSPCYAATTKIAWNLPYRGKAEVTILDGDKVSFTWNTRRMRHDVFQVNGAGNYNKCATTAKTGKALTKAVSRLTYTTPALTPGTYYYTCSVRGHCSAKQKVKVDVAVKWQARMTPQTINMKVGETLHFQWADNLPHDLNLLTGKAAYDACNTGPSGVSQVLVDDSRRASYKFGPLKKGTFYLACGVRGHCPAGGQKVTVVVT